MQVYIDEMQHKNRIEMLLVEDTTPTPVAVLEDFRECVNCRDKKKYGGPNTRKQSCVLKHKSGSRKRKNRPL